MMQTKKDDEFTHTLSKVDQSDEWADFHTWVCLVDLVYISLQVWCVVICWMIWFHIINPLNRVAVLGSMSFQLANISGALNRAREAIAEATLCGHRSGPYSGITW